MGGVFNLTRQGKQMNNEIHEYKFNDMSIIMPRHWVPISELEKLANELGFEDSNNLDNIFDSMGIDTQGESADFNGINFFLLHKGQVSGHFLSKIIKHNFDDDYVTLVDFMNYLKVLQVSIGKGHANQEVKEVLSVLKTMISA